MNLILQNMFSVKSWLSEPNMGISDKILNGTISMIVSSATVLIETNQDVREIEDLTWVLITYRFYETSLL